jgi:hypothetical protein
MKSVKNFTSADAVCFIESCMIWIGAGFHPDTPMSQYVTLGKDGQPTFTPNEVIYNQERLNKAFELLGDDIYECGMEIGYKLGYYPRPDDHDKDASDLEIIRMAFPDIDEPKRDAAADELARAAKALIEAKLLMDGYNNKKTPEYNGARERLLNALTGYYKANGTPNDLMRQG